ncbi:MAG TPA: hypothetical protein DCG65_07255 [Hyphomonas atlantica]|uniref:Uncharacterized protein n=1 Tax=Hyphomonas atlantica TaxID=1280948 RepID=A0A3B9L0A4_9PROT|nr:hypothetical protein [Hyphomonas atlantica]
MRRLQGQTKLTKVAIWLNKSCRIRKKLLALPQKQHKNQQTWRKKRFRPFDQLVCLLKLPKPN